VLTAEARASLPEQVTHRAAAMTAAHATLLGASIAAHDPGLFAASLHDELHEPYRAATAPAFDAVRTELPPGAVGVTISGSGPTVIVWAARDREDECARALEERFTDATVMQLRVSPAGVERA
jgi:homoserine kinase